jgi:NAD(P)-dependent dehydrogenase (short-subunit alcohol dehydrogenase family)
LDFKGKVIVVTGGGSGIGRACVRAFSERNGSVAVVDRDKNAGEETVEHLRGRGIAQYFQADVSAENQVAQLVPQIASNMGGIDVLVNNAGIQRYGTATSTSEKEWDEVINVNLKSAFLMSKYALPKIIERGGGAIVITGSAQSVSAVRNSVAYVVSKHGLLGLTRSLALDYAQDNVRVNCVCPGAIDTPMLRWSASLDADPEKVLDACGRIHALGRMGKPEEVANTIVFLSSDLASFITGAAIMVDGGLLVPAGGMAFQESGTGGAAK